MGTFQAEFDFKGLGDYKSAYLEQIQSIQGKVKNIQDMEKGIYGNVITILTIFVTIFTILNMNIELAKTSATDPCVPDFNLAIWEESAFWRFPCRTHRQRQEVEPMAVVDPVGMLYSNDSSELICIMYFLAPGFGLGRFFC